MPSKRCMICGNLRSIDERSLCCEACEEQELDLLITTYAFLHCSNRDFYPIPELVKEIEPINGIQVSSTFIRSWLKKQWLEKNDREEVCVPGSVAENLMENGFSVNTDLVDELHRRRDNRSKHDPNEFKNKRPAQESKEARTGMIYMEKFRKQ
ncbi:MAG: hypothetical protein GC154_03215 [bacterium]|nr:hypothetical protein [bacterium]